MLIVKSIKFLLILLVLIVGIAIRIRASNRHKGLTRDLKKARTDHGYASDLIDSLEFFYGGIEFSAYQDAVDKINQIQMNQKVGSYYFDELIEVDSNRFICPVKREVIMDDEKTNKPIVAGFELMIFAIIVNQEKLKVEVYSDLFEDLEDKQNKSGFSSALKEYLDL